MGKTKKNLAEQQRLDRLYDSMTLPQLIELRHAFVLDRREARGGTKTVRFCDERIAAIDRHLAGRETRKAR